MFIGRRQARQKKPWLILRSSFLRQTSVPTNELDTLAWYKEPGLKQLTDGTFEFITEAATVCDVADRRQGAMVVA